MVFHVSPKTYLSGFYGCDGRNIWAVKGNVDVEAKLSDIVIQI